MLECHSPFCTLASDYMATSWGQPLSFNGLSQQVRQSFGLQVPDPSVVQSHSFRTLISSPQVSQAQTWSNFRSTQHDIIGIPSLMVQLCLLTVALMNGRKKHGACQPVHHGKILHHSMRLQVLLMLEPTVAPQ